MIEEWDSRFINPKECLRGQTEGLAGCRKCKFYKTKKCPDPHLPQSQKNKWDVPVPVTQHMKKAKTVKMWT